MKRVHAAISLPGLVLVVCILTALVFASARSSKQTPVMRSPINGPSALALYQDRFLFVVENLNRVRRIDLKKGTLITVAGNGKDCCYNEGAPATRVSLGLVDSIAVDSQGNLFIPDTDAVRKVDARSGLIFTVARNETGGLALDSRGNLFIADAAKGKIFKVEVRTGAVSTIAGTGKADFSGDGGLAVNATFRGARSIAFDSTDNLFVADVENCRIRRIDHATGVIETIAQTGGTEQNCPPQPGVIPWQLSPDNPVIDIKENVYFIEPSVNLVVEAGSSPDRQVIVAGTGKRGFSGDGGPATSAELGNPSGLAIDSEGNLFISEFVNNRIRRIDGTTRLITTVAGNGLPHRMDVEM